MWGLSDFFEPIAGTRLAHFAKRCFSMAVRAVRAVRPQFNDAFCR
jgi:hypothetical protein